MINIKPIIGIVGRLYKGEKNFICVEEIRVAINKLGGIPLLILPSDGDSFSDIKRVLEFCDGFILPGGDTWFLLDELVINYAIEYDKPLFGICLGMQALAKVLSGNKTPIYDNTIKNSTSINHFEPNEDYVHEVIVDKESKLFSIINSEVIKVNSRHSYHVPPLEDTYISAFSSDGLIEGVELKNKKFIIGVQWHPESILEKDEPSKKLFKSFLENSQKFHEKNS